MFPLKTIDFLKKWLFFFDFLGFCFFGFFGLVSSWSGSQPSVLASWPGSQPSALVSWSGSQSRVQLAGQPVQCPGQWSGSQSHIYTYVCLYR